MSRWCQRAFLPIFLSVAYILCGCNKKASKWPYLVKIGENDLRVEVAITDEEQRYGLMNRDSMPEDVGMLFIYESEEKLAFWMKNTRIPLSIAFIDADKTIRDIQQMEPYDETNHASRVPAKYALEVNQGWFERHGVEVGSKVEFSTQLEELTSDRSNARGYFRKTRPPGRDVETSRVAARHRQTAELRLHHHPADF